jgi:hypothetical protein
VKDSKLQRCALSISSLMRLVMIGFVVLLILYHRAMSSLNFLNTEISDFGQRTQEEISYYPPLFPWVFNILLPIFVFLWFYIQMQCFLMSENLAKAPIVSTSAFNVPSPLIPFCLFSFL